MHLVLDQGLLLLQLFLELLFLLALSDLFTKYLLTVVLFVGVVIDAICLFELATVWGACSFADAEWRTRFYRISSYTVDKALSKLLLITFYCIFVFLELVKVCTVCRFFSIFTASWRYFTLITIVYYFRYRLWWLRLLFDALWTSWSCWETSRSNFLLCLSKGELHLSCCETNILTAFDNLWWAV